MKITERKNQLRKGVELVGLCALVATVWGLFTLPIILQFAPKSVENPAINNSVQLNGSASNVLKCREGFFREEEQGRCIPDCLTWNEFTPTQTVILDVITITTAIIGLLSSLAVLVVSFIRFKKVCNFPSVFFVYTTLDVLIIALFAIIPYIDQSTLFCSSRNLYDSLLKVTPYCVISGIVLMYCLIQLFSWWMCHVIVLFWKIQHPYHAQSFEAARRDKYIHILCLLIGFLLPLVPIVTTMAKFAVDVESSESPRSKNVTFASGGMGFGVAHFPPVYCFGVDRGATFYSFILLHDGIVAVGTTILILIFWSIHKKMKRKRSDPFGVAEKKILITFCYCVILGTIGLAGFTIRARSRVSHFELALNYFNCEAAGHDERNPCNKTDLNQITANQILMSLASILFFVFPVVNLMYVINIKELKDRFNKLSKINSSI